MPRIVSIHTLEPLPGTDPQEFARILEQAASAGYMLDADGWRACVVKGDRGDAKGQFALIHEFDSVDARNRYFPTEDGAPSADAERAFSAMEPTEFARRWESLIKEIGYTDYVLLAP